MINAYRTERLAQRLVLRTSPQQTYPARGTDAAKTNPAAAVTDVSAASAPEDTKPSDIIDPDRVVANPVSNAVEGAPCTEATPEPQLTSAAQQDNCFALALPSNDDPPLAAIGFGPCMLIRLGQLGLHTTGDLARADAAQLRAALGDISRLVDVEAWINSAQRMNASRVA